MSTKRYVLLLDVALADRAAALAQRRLFITLVGNEEDVDLVEGVDRLDGHMLGISGADADDEDLAHRPGAAAQATRSR
jgi:hypothetical protein